MTTTQQRVTFTNLKKVGGRWDASETATVEGVAAYKSNGAVLVVHDPEGRMLKMIAAALVISVEDV